MEWIEYEIGQTCSCLIRHYYKVYTWHDVSVSGTIRR